MRVEDDYKERADEARPEEHGDAVVPRGFLIAGLGRVLRVMAMLRVLQVSFFVKAEAGMNRR